MGGEDIFREADRQSNLGNYKRAYALLLEAEAQGYWPAQNSIGYLLDHGLGVRKNKRAAFLWYKKAARNGDLCAMANVGLCYRDRGDDIRAKFWLKRALAAGDGDAAVELAKLYARRLNYRGNRRKTRHYLKLATESKSITGASREDAREMLGKIETDGASRRR